MPPNVGLQTRRGPRPAVNLFGWIEAVDACPWGAVAGRAVGSGSAQRPVLQRSISRQPARPLYTREQRRRRDSSRWTLVQGILAPVQFLVFLVSLGLVLNYVLTGTMLQAATWSVVAKTMTLYAIMVTGAIWEHDVFGRYLFAPAFFWEDAFSMLVLALHSAYLVALATGALPPHLLMLLALAAYAAYAINAAQFVLKLRLARREAVGELA